MRYPLFLDLANQPVVVIGAGQVATRKIRTLLAAGATVTVISPMATAPIRRLAATKWDTRPACPSPAGTTETVVPLSKCGAETFPVKGRLEWRRRRYRPGDLRRARLVVAATNDPEVNQQVCREARRRRLLVNCIAPPAAGNFIVPSLVRHGQLQIAISTGGASPALAKQVRQELEVFFRRGYPPRRGN